MYVGCTIAFDYVDWMWHLLSMDCSGRHAQETPVEVSIIR